MAGEGSREPPLRAGFEDHEPDPSGRRPPDQAAAAEERFRYSRLEWGGLRHGAGQFGDRAVHVDGGPAEPDDRQPEAFGRGRRREPGGRLVEVEGSGPAHPTSSRSGAGEPRISNPIRR